MSDEPLTDDQNQSHYEISLTAGQAFVAFVLLLLSLAASFAFGLMIGKGQADERLVVRKEPAVINEGSVLPAKKSDSGKIVELPVTGDDFKSPDARTDTTVTTTAPAAPVVTETTTVAPATDTQQSKPITPASNPPAPQPRNPATPQQSVYVQLLSSVDQKTAEGLAAKLIDNGYSTAFVERNGTAFKVRVRFATETEARAAEGKLKTFSKDVWIVK